MRQDQLYKPTYEMVDEIRSIFINQPTNTNLRGLAAVEFKIASDPPFTTPLPGINTVLSSSNKHIKNSSNHEEDHNLSHFFQSYSSPSPSIPFSLALLVKVPMSIFTSIALALRDCNTYNIII